MTGEPRRFCLLAEFLVAIVLLGAASAGRASDAETRRFQIFIDNRPAGSYYMSFSERADGSIAVSERADVRIRYLLISYHYSYRGTEVWKDGRLLQLDANSDDDGKRFSVAARAEAESLRVVVNGQESRLPKDVWPTSAWRLPDAKHRNGQIAVLDVDTGRQLAGNISHVGTSRLNVAGAVEDCVHYRITGGVQIDAWYDAQERLVRQEAVDDGHHVRWELRSR
jgi:hypothetical protein